MLISDAVDIALNDQRRKFADAYVNLILDTAGCSIEVSSDSPLAALTQITPSELKNTPCIIVTSEAQQENEREYYHHIMGFQGDFIYADNLDDARLLVIQGKGFMPLEGSGQLMKFGDSVARIPLFLGDEQVTRNYCAFWKKDNSGYYVEAFAELLKLKYQ